MRFEVRDRKGRTVFQTEHKECIPDRKTRKSMKEHEYKLFLNGKPYKEGTV